MRSLVRVCVLVLVGLVAVLGLALPAQAGAPEPAARYVLGGAAGDGATCDFAVGGDRYDVVLAVPRESFGRDVRCAEVRSEIHVGPYDPQPAPHSSSTTVSWEVCIWLHTPWGGFKWCLKITITTSTTIPNNDVGIEVMVLSAEGGSSPVKFCWDEELRNGKIATHCIEITIDAGGSTG